MFAVLITVFSFNHTATAYIYTLSLHDALPIFQAVVLVGKPLARTAEAVDDLIENEQHAVAAADVLHRPPVLRRRHQHAHAALDGLHDDRGHRLRAFRHDGVLQRPGRRQLRSHALQPKGTAV